MYSQKSQHIVEMTEFYVCNFTHEDSPKFVATRDITSCVILLLKNIDNNGQCSAFGMAHINYCNVYYSDVGKESLKNFIAKFEEKGGDLKNASVQLLGGLLVDPNNVREKIKDILTKIASDMKQSILVKEPKGFQNNINYPSEKIQQAEFMAVACDTKQTYIRKILINNEKKILDRKYNDVTAETFLSDDNFRKIFNTQQHIQRYNDMKLKTVMFYSLINKINPFLSILPRDNKEIEEIVLNLKTNLCPLINSLECLEKSPELGFKMSI